MKEYEAFLEKQRGVPEGETSLTLQDRETFEEFQARVLISKRGGEGFDKLIVRFRDSFGLEQEECYVRILERIEEEEEETPVRVRSRLRLAERRGFMIRSMLEEKEQGEEGNEGGEG